MRRGSSAEGDGNLLHDILIDGVFDAVRGNRFVNFGLTHVKIGDSKPYYREFASRPGEMYNITVKNLHSTGKQPPLKVECVVSNLVVEQACSDWNWRDN